MGRKRDPRLKAFVKVDRSGNLVPSVLIYRERQPKRGNWIALDANVCCPSTTTSTTTTTTTTV